VNRRRLILGSALALTLAAVAWASRMEAPADSNVAAPPGPRAAAPAAPERDAAVTDFGLARVNSARQTEEAGPKRNAFAARSFYVPPPAPRLAPPPPPPPPQAPPLPFRYMGMLRDGDGRLQIFVTQGERVLTLAPGDVIDNIYRVEKIGTDEVTFRYIPLNELQTLRVGNT
jgi:hypothetical protein